MSSPAMSLIKPKQAESAEVRAFVIHIDEQTGRFLKYDPAYVDKQGQEFDWGPEKLRHFTLQELDTFSGNILKAPIPASKNKAAAAERFVATLKNLPFHEGEVKRQVGVVEKSRHPRTDLQTFALHPNFDFKSEHGQKLLEGLAPQARACIQIMQLGGKAKYTGAELTQLLESHPEILHTNQDPFRIFQYYRNEFIKNEIVQIAG